MSRRILRAYIDESGGRSRSLASSDHFVMAAAVFFDEHAFSADALLDAVRVETKRQVGQHLHWKNFSHTHRLAAAKVLGEPQHHIGFIAVVVCKRHLAVTGNFSEDDAYLLTFRYLLESLSWVAREQKSELHYTLAHIQRFKKATLREYEARIKNLPPSMCSVSWEWVNPKGGDIDQPKRLPYLQLADFAASSIGNAFEPGNDGLCHPEYVQEFSTRLWRKNGKLTTYGMKMHPWNHSTKAAYPWIAAL